MNYTKNKRKSMIGKVLSFLEGIATILVIIICLIITVQRISNNEKSFFGARLFKIESGSMIPRYNINDVILVNEIEISQIKVGDDLVYVGLEKDYIGKIITHEVVNIEKDGTELKFYTKGLNNLTIDPVVSSEQIIGIVTRKMYILTIITNILLNPYTLYFLVIIPLTVTIFLNEVHSKDLKEKKIKKKLEKEKIKNRKYTKI